MVFIFKNQCDRFFSSLSAHYQYKDTALKNTRWQAHANELGVEDWKTLRTWVESMRSQLGRLTREGNKSGSGRKDDTQRDKWIKEKFGFLGPHIARIETRGGINVCNTVFYYLLFQFTFFTFYCYFLC